MPNSRSAMPGATAREATPASLSSTSRSATKRAAAGQTRDGDRATWYLDCNGSHGRIHGRAGSGTVWRAEVHHPLLGAKRGPDPERLGREGQAVVVFGPDGPAGYLLVAPAKDRSEE